MRKESAGLLALDVPERQADSQERDEQRLGEGERGHGSRPLRWLSDWRRVQQVREALPGKSCQHTILDTRRELVGPLSHGRDGNADCIRDGRDGAAEQFNGLSFEHALILAR